MAFNYSSGFANSSIIPENLLAVLPRLRFNGCPFADMTGKTRRSGARLQTTGNEDAITRLESGTSRLVYPFQSLNFSHYDLFPVTLQQT
jgi:hypothetical protein